jgi:ketosteroid isomerase-like protein
MRRFNAVILGLLFCIFLISCNTDANEKADYKRLKATIDEFYDAVNSGDTDRRLALFAEGAIVMPDNGKLTRMTDSVKAVWKSWDENWVFRIKDLEHVEMSISGDIGYTVNEYFYIWHPKDGEPEWHKTKNIHIWRKQADGSWKLHADIWNSTNH